MLVEARAKLQPLRYPGCKRGLIYGPYRHHKSERKIFHIYMETPSDIWKSPI